jgi:adenosylcobinamide-phosphate synthase
MPLEFIILLSVAIDLIIGDPRWFPHPVKFIGRLALAMERPTRWILPPRIAGIFTVFLVVIVTALVSVGLVWGGAKIHPIAQDIVSIFLIYTGIAIRDMIKHSRDVWKVLRSGDLVTSRAQVAMICGRDTDQLVESQIVAATVESVAENLVDGVTAPLFFAVLAGPVGIITYKAVSTLDSTFGYKNDRYKEFGWASAKLDDIAAFIPSRLTGLIVPIAALFLKQRTRNSLRIFQRDRNKHPSPNAGQSEAAFAGALGVQLGGLCYYQGKPSDKPRLGDAIEPLVPDQIKRANRLMLMTTALFLFICLGVRIAITGFCR